jgi:putative transposase
MEIRRSIEVNIDPTDEQKQILLDTMSEYTQAFNYVVDAGFDDKCWNGVELHKRTYYDIRDRLNLPSQLIISARQKAAEAIKSVYQGGEKEKTIPTARSYTAIRYDVRSYSVWFDRNELSISTVAGRQRFSIQMPGFAREYTAWQTCSADLAYQDGEFHICITVKTHLPEPQRTGKHIGVDLGLSKTAVAADCFSSAEKHIRKSRNRHSRSRRKLRGRKVPEDKVVLVLAIILAVVGAFCLLVICSYANGSSMPGQDEPNDTEPALSNQINLPHLSRPEHVYGYVEDQACCRPDAPQDEIAEDQS